MNVSVHRSLKRTRRSLWSQAMILSLIVVCSVDILVEPVFAQQSSSASKVPVSFSGDSGQTAKNIWIPSIYGTYLITPDHLKGDKPIRFLGVPAESTREAVDYAPQEPAPLPLEPIR